MTSSDGHETRRQTSMTDTQRAALAKVIARGLALARDPHWFASIEGAPPGQVEWDAPPIPRLSAGLREGFTEEEEAWARRSGDFQRAVALYWRTRPVSFWLLARAQAEGSRFPFAIALAQHLDESDDGDRIVFNAPLIQRLAAVLRETIAPDRWLRLRERWLAWEAGVRRVSVALPATVGAFADIAATPFAMERTFGDGLKIGVEEGSTSQLQVRVSQPASAGVGRVSILLVGEKGGERAGDVPLAAYGDFAGGAATLGGLRPALAELGTRCVVVVAAEPPPLD
jgi:hypothetical protein